MVDYISDAGLWYNGLCVCVCVCVNAFTHLCVSIISLPFDLSVCLTTHLHTPSFNLSILLLSSSSLCHPSIHSRFQEDRRSMQVCGRLLRGLYFAQWEVSLAVLCLQFEVLFVDDDTN